MPDFVAPAEIDALDSASVPSWEMPVVLTALMKQIGCALCCRVREQKGWPASPPKFWVQQTPSGSRCWMNLCVLVCRGNRGSAARSCPAESTAWPCERRERAERARGEEVGFWCGCAGLAC